jgi:hypothetical protein
MSSIKFIFYFCFLITGCSEKNGSIPVTLYRDRIESGNSITSFVNANDPSGSIAMTYCEEFRKLYEVTNKEHKFICAPIAYKDFAPTIKWNLSN